MWAKSVLPISTRQNKNNSYPGFTIVELLIVIVVIAILAAITIVAFNGIQDRARSSAASQSASQAARKIKVWQVDNEATTPTCAQFYSLLTGTSSNTACSFDYNDSSYQYSPYAGGNFCVTTTVVNKSFYASESNSPTSGGCDGHGRGGVAAITNYSRNPSLESSNHAWGGWAGSGGTHAQSRVSGNAYDGTWSYRAVWSVGASGGINFTVPVTAGSTYTTSMYVRASKSTTVWCNWQNGGSTSTTFSLTANTWRRVTCTGTVPAGQTSIQFNVYGFNAAANDVLEGDAGMVVEGTQNYAYADGNSANWAWSDPAAPNASTSNGPPL